MALPVYICFLIYILLQSHQLTSRTIMRESTAKTSQRFALRLLSRTLLGIHSTESSLKRPRREIFLSGRKSFAFAEQLDCFTFIAILRHGANHASSLMFVPGDLRINVCSISGKPAHALCLTNIPCPYCSHCLI